MIEVVRVSYSPLSGYFLTFYNLGQFVCLVLGFEILVKVSGKTAAEVYSHVDLHQADSMEHNLKI